MTNKTKTDRGSVIYLKRDEYCMSLDNEEIIPPPNCMDESTNMEYQDQTHLHFILCMPFYKKSKTGKN